MTSIQSGLCLKRGIVVLQKTSLTKSTHRMCRCSEQKLAAQCPSPHVTLSSEVSSTTFHPIGLNRQILQRANLTWVWEGRGPGLDACQDLVSSPPADGKCVHRLCGHNENTIVVCSCMVHQCEVDPDVNTNTDEVELQCSFCKLLWPNIEPHKC